MLSCVFHGSSLQLFFFIHNAYVFFLHALASHHTKLLLLPQNTVKLHISATLCYTSAFSLLQKSYSKPQLKQNTIHSVMPRHNVLLLNSRLTILYSKVSWGLTCVRMNEVMPAFPNTWWIIWGQSCGLICFCGRCSVTVLPSELYNQGFRARTQTLLPLRLAWKASGSLISWQKCGHNSWNQIIDYIKILKH